MANPLQFSQQVAPVGNGLFRIALQRQFRNKTFSSARFQGSHQHLANPSAMGRHSAARLQLHPQWPGAFDTF